MKKKVRTITVRDTTYAWTVQELDWPNAVLRVWRSKNDLWFEEPRDPGDGAVTPGVVADKILQRLSADPE